MTFAGRTWGRMSPTARLTAIFVPLALLLAIAAVVAVVLVLPALVNFLGANVPLVRFVVAVVAILVLTIPTAFVLIYMELKVIARVNLRVGPNRIGPWGTATSLVHGFKVLSKEDFAPTGADMPVFTLAPVVTFLASVMTLLVIPFAPGIFGQDFNIGLLFFFAMGGLSVLGLLMAGWASFNKYSLLGGLRSAAQIVSYETPLTISVVGVVILAGTMSMNHIVLAQSGSALDWFVFKQPLAVLIFFIAATAEANRTPFDMTEADSEIVAGFATEYSGMRFGFFFFAEYVNVFIVSALLATIFFGGWTAPFDWPWPYNLNWLAASSIGILWIPIALLALFVGTGVMAVAVRLIGGREWTAPSAFGLGFIITGAAMTALLGLALFIAFDWAQGIFWFMAKTYAFVFTFVWMRGTLPRVRVDQLMGFAWKWLLPASLLNLFVTAAAVIILNR
ncbi:MAG: complex I subunit 1 family protein [Candidatus Limnocylindrales bacterium]|jgi:NADH-quinone oxidoreductase subunit H